MSYFDNKKRGYHKFLVQPPEGSPYKGLKDLEVGAEYIMTGGFISTKGKFGPSPVIYTQDFYVNLPASLMDDVRELLSCAEDCNKIDLGEVCFRVYEYEHPKYGTCRSAEIYLKQKGVKES